MEKQTDVVDTSGINDLSEDNYLQDVLSAEQISRLKAKYNKIYSVTVEIVEDDENSKEIQYIFVKPKVSSYDRYLKTAAKGMTKALQAFLMDNIVEEQLVKLGWELEEYPALSMGIGEKLLALLGLSNNVNLMKL